MRFLQEIMYIDAGSVSLPALHIFVRIEKLNFFYYFLEFEVFFLCESSHFC